MPNSDLNKIVEEIKVIKSKEQIEIYELLFAIHKKNEEIDKLISLVTSKIVLLENISK
jgi:hypothetical protein